MRQSVSEESCTFLWEISFFKSLGKIRQDIRVDFDPNDFEEKKFFSQFLSSSSYAVKQSGACATNHFTCVIYFGIMSLSLSFTSIHAQRYKNFLSVVYDFS